VPTPPDPRDFGDGGVRFGMRKWRLRRAREPEPDLDPPTAVFGFDYLAEPAPTKLLPVEPSTADVPGNAVQLEPAISAGWYPDWVDPDAIRLWDGIRWTNYVTPRPPPLESLGTAPNHTTPSQPEPDRRAEPVLGGSAFCIDDLPGAPMTAGGSDSCLSSLVDALGQARASGSPDAWGEAERAASTVLEMVRVLHAGALARRRVDDLELAANTAAQAADIARAEAELAAHTAEEMAQVARTAAEAAMAAKAEAEQLAAFVPQAALVAQAAADAADDARCKAEALLRAISLAQTSGGPPAWAEAVRLTEAGMAAAQGPGIR
jgi:Protein of unknown function (DUF2510)